MRSTCLAIVCLLNVVGSLFWYFKVPYVCDGVVEKFTFAISSPDEFL